MRENLGVSTGTGRSRGLTKPAVPRVSASSKRQGGASSSTTRSTAGGGGAQNASSPGGVPVDGVGGIGIVLSMPQEGRRTIKSLTKGGPAEENGAPSPFSSRPHPSCPPLPSMASSRPLPKQKFIDAAGEHPACKFPILSPLGPSFPHLPFHPPPPCPHPLLSPSPPHRAQV